MCVAFAVCMCVCVCGVGRGGGGAYGVQGSLAGRARDATASVLAAPCDKPAAAHREWIADLQGMKEHTENRRRKLG
jgi:NAD(P)H-hydrate repair Nnr-like enzyme with NAD(P)H-hydrate epimerase domain